MKTVQFNETRHLLPKLRIRLIEGGTLYRDQKKAGVVYEDEDRQLAAGEIVGRGGERVPSDAAVRDTIKGKKSSDAHPLKRLGDLHLD